LGHAKAEDDLARRDAPAGGATGAGRSAPRGRAVRERLAMSLFNTLNYAKAEDDLARRDALLEELRALAVAHPEDAAVRERLAMGLAKTMLDAADEGLSGRWGRILSLRLARGARVDGAVDAG
jgi:hypothetical protein